MPTTSRTVGESQSAKVGIARLQHCLVGSMSALTGLLSRLRSGIRRERQAAVDALFHAQQQLGSAGFSHEAKTHVDPTGISIVDFKIAHYYCTCKAACKIIDLNNVSCYGPRKPLAEAHKHLLTSNDASTSSRQ